MINYFNLFVHVLLQIHETWLNTRLKVNKEKSLSAIDWIVQLVSFPHHILQHMLQFNTHLLIKGAEFDSSTNRKRENEIKLHSMLLVVCQVYKSIGEH